MELYKEILAHALTYADVHISFSGQNPDLSKIVENTCYIALQRIKAILDDDALSDAECFSKIEAIVTTFEEIGSNGGNRHDFG